MTDVYLRRPLKVRRAASAALAALLPAALLATTAATVGTSAAASAASSGGTVVVALPALADINWYQPLRPAAYNTVYDSWVATLLYQPLLAVNGKGAIDYTYSDAESISANASGTVYTVNMNPIYHWSDGTPVTAADIAFCWQLIEYASSAKAPTPWPYAGAGSGDIPTGVKSLKVTGTYSFQVTLEQPVNAYWFEYDGLSQLFPLPKQAWDKYPTNIAKELNYITTNGDNASFFNVVDGPFMLKSAVNDSAWTFVPNPKFNGHKATLGQLILAYETSDQNELEQLQQGEVQVGYINQAELGDQHLLTKDRLITGYGDGFTRMFLDYGNPTVGKLLAQLPVRQAMEMGINQTQIIKDIDEGYAVYGAGPVPYSQPSLLAPGMTKPPYPFNPALGKATLEKAGYHLVNGVMTNAQGQQLSFVMQYVSGSPETESIVQLVQSDWAKEGIKVSLVPMPFASMVALHDKTDAAKWEIQAGVSWDWGGDYPTGEGIFETGAPYNFYQFSDPTLDKLIQASIKPYPTTAQSVAALKAYEVYVSKVLPVLWMPYAATLDEVATNLKGVNANTLNTFVDGFEPQYWSISQ